MCLMVFLCGKDGWEGERGGGLIEATHRVHCPPAQCALLLSKIGLVRVVARANHSRLHACPKGCVFPPGGLCISSRRVVYFLPEGCVFPPGGLCALIADRSLRSLAVNSRLVEHNGKGGKNVAWLGHARPPLWQALCLLSSLKELGERWKQHLAASAFTAQSCGMVLDSGQLQGFAHKTCRE